MECLPDRPEVQDLYKPQ
ncbi:uncharacterized protein FFNC_15535 [Fusarium fujikuroi]|nr:uncharacterized protein FFNC_15535 [Fusarium fujikuroi]